MTAKRRTGVKPHALIIGGTRGAGRLAVCHLSAEGYRVSVLARTRPTAGSQHARHVRYWEADITDSAGLKRALVAIYKARGRFDCVAFFQRYRGKGDAWRGEIETSLTGTRNVIEMLVTEFALRDAAIIIVSSVIASFVSKSAPLSYHVAKAGMNQIVRYYAVSLGARGVRVNSVSPGTFIKEESRVAMLAQPKLVKLYQQIIPLGRLCTAGEVVDVVTFLAGSRSAFITGQDIVVDGGLSLVSQETLARDLVPVGRP